MHKLIADHCNELNRCNQRGGRMLTVFDLLDAGTLNLDLASYLMARISRGASFMVGALPGGAGKTTIMCALLNFIPADVRLIAATSQAVEMAHSEKTTGRNCYICHEIGSGHYFAYLWGHDLRNYCGLLDSGHILATNLHADDIDEIYDQLCTQNNVSQEHFNRFDLLIFIQTQGGYFDPQRHIGKIYSSDAQSGHTLVYDRNSNVRPKADQTNNEYITACRTFLETEQERGIRTIEQTRQAVIEFLENHPDKQTTATNGVNQ